MKNNFQTIKNHPEYEIDEFGHIRKKNGEMKHYASSNGHPKVYLDGKTEYVSRLVAEAYIPNPDSKSDILHLDGDLQNNAVENLKWATKSEVQLYPYGGLGGFFPGGAEEAKKVRVIELEETYPSIRSCARAIGGTPSGIRQCLKGQLKTYKGFTFELV